MDTSLSRAFSRMARIEQDRLRTENVVWLLGAGFSKPLGGPLFSELISHRLSSWIECWLESQGVRVSFPEEVADFFEKGQQKEFWENAEECLALINEARSDETTRAVVEDLGLQGTALDDMEMRLSHFVAASTSHFVHRSMKADRLPEAWTPYEEWVRLLSDRDSIISFNYDRVVENLLRRSEKRTNLVKLHGTVPATEDLCADIRDGKSISCIAIPGPGKTKARENPAVAPDWEKAESILGQANRLVVIGYSFPASDAYVRFFVLSKCRAKRVDVVVGPEPCGDIISGMFARFLGKDAVRNTRLLAQEYLAEGAAQPVVNRFNHGLKY